MKKVTKRYFTLVEMMVVITIIMIFTGVLAYNMMGTLESAKEDATKTEIAKLESILSIEVAKDPSLMDNISSQWVDVLRKSPLVKNADDLSKDAWGYRYDVQVEDGVLIIRSEGYEKYLEQQSK